MTAFLDFNNAANNFLNSYFMSKNNRIRREQAKAQADAEKQKIMQDTLKNYGGMMNRGRQISTKLSQAEKSLYASRRSPNESLRNAQELKAQTAQEEWKLWLETEGKLVSPKAKDAQFRNMFTQDTTTLRKRAEATIDFYRGQGQAPSSSVLAAELVTPSSPEVVNAQEAGKAIATEENRRLMQQHSINAEGRAQAGEGRAVDAYAFEQGNRVLRQQHSINAEGRAQNQELRNQAGEVRAQNREGRSAEAFVYEQQLKRLNITDKQGDIALKQYKAAGDLGVYLWADGVDPHNVTPQDIVNAQGKKRAAELAYNAANQQQNITVKQANERPSQAVVSALGGYSGDFMRKVAEQNAVSTGAVTANMLRSAGVSKIPDTVARGILKRKSGMNDVHLIGSELIKTIQTGGPVTRGAVGGIPRVVMNLENAWNSVKTLAGYNKNGKVYDEAAGQEGVEQFNRMLADPNIDQYVPSAFDQITGDHQKSKILTLQLAFALAAAEGLEGRAVTDSILEQRFKPMAASEIHTPQTAIRLIKDVIGITERRFRIFEKNTLGINVGGAVSLPETSKGQGDLFQNSSPVPPEQTDGHQDLLEEYYNLGLGS